MSHWRGLALSVVGIAATLSLALGGRLDWYIHPRYIVFTVTMTVLGAATAVLAAVFLWRDASRTRTRTAESNGRRGADTHPADDPRRGDDVHVHDHGARRPGALALLSTGVLVGIAAIALLVIPPATLTAATAGQREMNATLTPGSSEPEVALGDVDDPAELDVKQWSLLLRQNGGEEAVGRSAELLGFVTADDEAPEDVFYVARFSVTCCTIDAQPVGVPVYAPGWQDDFSPDTWVEVTGVFAANPDPDGAQPVILMPAETAETEMPEDPYVH